MSMVMVAACFIEVHYKNFIKKKKQEKEKALFSCKETKEKSRMARLNCNKT